MAPPIVDWQRLRDDVDARIDILEAAWNDALKRGARGEKVIDDLFMRLLEMLGGFCAASEIIEESKGGTDQPGTVRPPLRKGG